MTPRPREFNPTLIARLEAFSRATGSFVIVVGCLVLLGWVLGRGALASVFPAAGAMKANAAFCFILAGASLRLMQTGPDTPRTRLVVQGYAWAVSVVGLLTLSEHLLGWNLHIDQLLVRETQGVVATTVPGRMAPAEAGTFLLLGVALLLLGDPSPQWRRSSQGLTLTAALISWEALLGHAYGVALYAIPAYRFTRVGAHTALAFTLLSLGILARQPRSGVMAIFTCDSAGGYMARRVLPAAVGVLSLLGWLGLEGERLAYYDTAAGVALMVAATLVIFAALIAWNARALERVEDERARLMEEQSARAQAEAAERRAAFLAQASATLSASLDYDSTLKSVADLAVPHLADWCAVCVLDAEGEVRLVAAAHQDPSKVPLAWDESRRYLLRLSAPHGPGRVIHTGEPELVSEISDSLLRAVAGGAEHLALLRGLGFVSYMAVPLSARGRTLGAITFASAESGRRFGRADLALAEELAHGAALAVDKARHYEAEGRARAAAEAASRAKDAFLATVSHELRTPLSPILAWSRMLRQGTLGEEKTRRALEVIERCARSQAQLVEDLLDVSRIISGKLRLEVRPVTLAPVVQAAVEVVRPAAEAKGLELQAVLDSEVGAVTGDPERLKQVVWNLASNAVKFTPKGGRVEVRLARVEGHVEITVRDSGQGIRPDFLPHIFQRFEQADSTSTRAHGGLGLGLAIVRHIVELHGGTVHAESSGEGQGAVFTVRLLLAAAQTAGEAERRPPSPSAPASQCEEAALDGLRVLVVDDEPDNNDVVGTLLSSRGAEVRLAGSARQAVEMLREWKPDILVTDIAMPDQDGYDLLASIRSQEGEPAEILAVALTAYASREDRIRLLSAGFQAHVAKPVDPAELTAVVASLGRTAQRLRAQAGRPATAHAPAGGGRPVRVA